MESTAIAIAIAVAVSAVTAVHELTRSRDDRLNKKAHMRAIMQTPLENNRWTDSSTSAGFTFSQDVSTNKMTEERIDRERILQMQNDISLYLAQL